MMVYEVSICLTFSSYIGHSYHLEGELQGCLVGFAKVDVGEGDDAGGCVGDVGEGLNGGGTSYGILDGGYAVGYFFGKGFFAGNEAGGGLAGCYVGRRKGSNESAEQRERDKGIGVHPCK